MTVYVDQHGTQVAPPEWQVDSLRRLGLIHKVTFDCDVCGFESSTKAGLAAHSRIHDNDDVQEHDDG